MKYFAVLLVAASALFSTPARADETHVLGKDTTMIVGYKLWLNTWQTGLAGGDTSNGGHISQITTNGVAQIPSFTLKHQDFLFSISHLASSKYPFPMETEALRGTANVIAVNTNGRRHETDINFGYYVIPQLVLTTGYKNVEQRYDQTITGGALAPAAFITSMSKTHMNGITFGIAGSAPVGNGFSFYGSGVGGFMDVTYTPSAPKHDFASYTGSEIGFAWRGHVPVTLTLGYKYQVITTSTARENNPGLANQKGVDLTHGWILGANYMF